MTFLNMNFLLISIHAPRGGSDMKYLPDLLKVQVFQSTLPAWGATGPTKLAVGVKGISIHAPHRGSDDTISPSTLHLRDFNPRSPQGERQ